MDSRQWLESVLEKLAPCNLPMNYQQRLLEELAHHLDDLMEETMSITVSVEQRMGDPGLVANAAAEAQRRRGSRSWLAVLAKLFGFVVLPLPAVIVMWGLIGWLGLAVFGSLLGTSRETLPEWLKTAMSEHQVGIRIGLLALLVAISSLVTVAYGVVVRRFGLNWRWMLMATLLVVLVTAPLTMKIEYTGVTGQNSISAGLGFTGAIAPLLLQGALPLVVGLWFVVRQARQARGFLAGCA
ncbi:MAG: hypothetical protein FJ295_00300 [Planctomycetes bacterium]|nr:hypothetical protein [Planctomycetota bacterium]